MAMKKNKVSFENRMFPGFLFESAWSRNAFLKSEHKKRNLNEGAIHKHF